MKSVYSDILRKTPVFIRPHKQPVTARDSDVNMLVWSRVLYKSATHSC